MIIFLSTTKSNLQIKQEGIAAFMEAYSCHKVIQKAFFYGIIEIISTYSLLNYICRWIMNNFPFELNSDRNDWCFIACGPIQSLQGCPFLHSYVIQQKQIAEVCKVLSVPYLCWQRSVWMNGWQLEHWQCNPYWLFISQINWMMYQRISVKCDQHRMYSSKHMIID